MIEYFGLVETNAKFVSVGDVYGLLTVEFVGKDPKTDKYYSLCRCLCGSDIKKIRSDSLKDGSILSCGCYQKKVSTKHGGSKYRHPERWKNMMDRCYNVNSKSYKYYGERGIKVCDRWHDVNNYVKDILTIGEYKQGMELDRIDNNGNYEPNNVRWVTRKQNCNNRRSSKIILFNGVKDSITNHAEKQGLSPKMVMERIKNGWTIDRALTEKKGENSARKTKGDALRNKAKLTSENYQKKIKRYELNGKSMTIRELSEFSGLPVKLLRKRIQERGWSAERAVSTIV